MGGAGGPHCESALSWTFIPTRAPRRPSKNRFDRCLHRCEPLSKGPLGVRAAEGLARMPRPVRRQIHHAVQTRHDNADDSRDRASFRRGHDAAMVRRAAASPRTPAFSAPRDRSREETTTSSPRHAAPRAAQSASRNKVLARFGRSGPRPGRWPARFHPDPDPARAQRTQAMAPAPTLKRSEASGQRSTLSCSDRRKLETRQARLDVSHTLLASRNLDALIVDVTSPFKLDDIVNFGNIVINVERRTADHTLQFPRSALPTLRACGLTRQKCATDRI